LSPAQRIKVRTAASASACEGLSFFFGFAGFAVFVFAFAMLGLSSETNGRCMQSG
jgi:hypothetical protein